MWSTMWQMLFNMDKCHVVHVGKQNPCYEYAWGMGMLSITECERDVGDIVTANLKPSEQCVQAAKKANKYGTRSANYVCYIS